MAGDLCEAFAKTICIACFVPLTPSLTNPDKFSHTILGIIGVEVPRHNAFLVEADFSLS